MSTTPSEEERRESAREGALPPPDYDYGIRRRPRNGAGVASLVVGVSSLVLAVLVLFFPLAGLLAVVAIVLGLIGLRLYARGEADNRGQSIAGVATGVVALLLVVLVGVSVATFFAEHQTSFRRLGTCLAGADTDKQRAACARRLARAFRTGQPP
jgi:hypothetical protein